MNVLLQRERAVKDTSADVTVPANNVARLMYYLRCVTRSLGVDVLPARLVDFSRWAYLSDSEDDAVYTEAWRFSPDELLDKIIFHDTDGTLCGTSSNRFLELSEATSLLAVSGSAVVGGTSRTATRVMIFTTAWLTKFYIHPMRSAAGRLTRLRVRLILHCRHCGGAAASCACTHGCARREWSECTPRRRPAAGTLLSALVDELAGARLADPSRHCSHCKGLGGGRCGCGVCPRPAGARCVDHCAHCWGLPGACDCKAGCGRLATTACTPRHQAWCDGCAQAGQEIVGDRYKCGGCADVDFCAPCYAADRRHRRHPFTRSSQPGGVGVRLEPREAAPPPPRPAAPLPRPAARAAPAAAAAAAATGSHPGFRAGERVVLAGLKAAAMNGAAAVVVDPVAGGGRAEVRLVAGGGHYNIRYENMRGGAVDLD